RAARLARAALVDAAPAAIAEARRRGVGRAHRLLARGGGRARTLRDRRRRREAELGGALLLRVQAVDGELGDALGELDRRRALGDRGRRRLGLAEQPREEALRLERGRRRVGQLGLEAGGVARVERVLARGRGGGGRGGRWRGDGGRRLRREG